MEAWQLLRHNQPDDALRIMRATYAANQASPSLAIELGAFYLYLQEWQAAWKHFCDLRAFWPQSMDIACVLAGTARWCAGDYNVAVQEWNDGLAADYTDNAGGITIPLHLFFAAVCHRKLIETSEAAELLRNRLDRPHGHLWPSHLARLVLCHISYDEALGAGLETIEHLQGDQFRQSREFITFRVGFWNGVKKRALGDELGFRGEMRECGAFSWGGFQGNEGLTIDRFRSSEFHLARSEDVSAVAPDRK